MASMGRALVSHGGGARYLLENDQIPRRGQKDCGMLGTGGRQRPSLCGPARPLVAEAGTAEAPAGRFPRRAFASPGATRDIGSALTRMCMRHRSIETKLRQFTK